MRNDDSSCRTRATERRSPDILAAGEQIEAARFRQQDLIASGRLARPIIDGTLPTTTLPGYALLRELHRGGQGVVYLAVQESTGRHVAIKLLHSRPLAGSGATGLARFRREIEVLSKLKHPNIVTVHDCGRDHEHVYLVMDYVNGHPLDEHVHGGRGSLSDTLDLFARTCDGVNAAHLRGVIHRDLKPGNILVDEHCQPRVLDFGLAKLADGAHDAGASAAAMTMTGQFVGSLPWASPEQAEGRTELLDIRTDVYSLGVILFQLLTGQFPYPVSGRIDEVVRTIVHTTPIRPSTIQRRIDRELETIALKCLAKEPERRYQSAGELARDIRRYLAGDAIEARRDSLGYLVAKGLARHRVAAIAAVTVLVAVISALVVSVAFWQQADKQRTIAQHSAAAAQESAERADREAEQASAVNDFMRDVLTSADPDNQGADVRLTQVLTRASVTAAQRFAARPEQEASVRDLLGEVFNNLSMWVEAQQEFGRAQQLWRDGAGPDDPRALRAGSRYAAAALNLDRVDDAARVLGDLMPRMERVFGPDDPHTLSARRDVAITHLQRGEVDEAERILSAIRAHPALADDDATQIRILAGLIGVTLHRASVADPEGHRVRLAEAETLAREWVERSMRRLGPESPVTLHAQLKLADILCQQGRFVTAVEICRRLLDHPYERLGAYHHVRTGAMFTLAEALARLGEHGEAADLHLRRIEVLRQQLPANSPVFLGQLGEALKYMDHANRPTEGQSLARELNAALLTLGGGHGEISSYSELYMARFASMQDRLDEAEPLFRSLLARGMDAEGPFASARLHLFYGSHLTRRGRFEEAERELQSAVHCIGDIRRGTWSSHPDDVIVGFIDLYEAWGESDKVEAYQRLRAEVRTRVLSDNSEHPMYDALPANDAP